VIEGACRYLLKCRMDITGARWGVAGAEVILHLRALRASGDFDSYWTFHEQRELARHHGAKYAGTPPPTIVPVRPSRRCRPALRLVPRSPSFQRSRTQLKHAVRRHGVGLTLLHS
jgi:hypothetical protein